MVLSGCFNFFQGDIMTEYDLQVDNFLKATDTKMTVTYIGAKMHFEDDKVNKVYRDCYRVTLTANGRRMKFIFGNSINATEIHEKPSSYDILSCLQVDYSSDFEDFCNNYGYSMGSSARKIYKAVQKESANLQRLYTEEQLEMLHEIC